MTGFLQTYGTWLIFGLLLLLMFRMHAGGHSHGGMMCHDMQDMRNDGSRRYSDQYIVDADPVKVTSTVTNQDDASADRRKESEASPAGSFGGKAASPDEEARSGALGPRHAGCH